MTSSGAGLAWGGAWRRRQKSLVAFGVMVAAAAAALLLPAPFPWIAAGAAFTAVLALLDAWMSRTQRLYAVRGPPD